MYYFERIDGLLRQVNDSDVPKMQAERIANAEHCNIVIFQSEEDTAAAKAESEAATAQRAQDLQMAGQAADAAAAQLTAARAAAITKLEKLGLTAEDIISLFGVNP
jgi:uncharacterized protein YciW